MSAVNKRILEAIENGKFTSEIKELLKMLLVIEARIAEDKRPRYTEDYDRIIKKIAAERGYQEDQE